MLNSGQIFTTSEGLDRLSCRRETVTLSSINIVSFIDLFVLLFVLLKTAVLISPLASSRVTILQGFLISGSGRMRRVVGPPTFKHNELLLTFLLLLRWNTSNFIEIISTLSQRLKSILCGCNCQLLVMIFPGCYSELQIIWWRKVFLLGYPGRVNRLLLAIRIIFYMNSNIRMLTFDHYLLRSLTRIVQTWCEELVKQGRCIVHQALRRRNCWALKVILWPWLKTLFKRIWICQMLRSRYCLLTFWLRWEKLIYCFFNAGRYSLRIKLGLCSNLCSTKLLLLLQLEALWNFIYLFDCYIRVSSRLS